MLVGCVICLSGALCWLFSCPSRSSREQRTCSGPHSCANYPGRPLLSFAPAAHLLAPPSHPSPNPAGKFHLILVESRIHRLARYYKKSKKLPPNWK